MHSADRSPLRGLLWLTAFTLPAFALLMGLSAWQWQRLSWKEGVMARMQQRMHAAPRPLADPADWPALAGGDYEYSRVQTAGTFDHSREFLLFRPAGGPAKQPGYDVFTPLRIDGAQRWIWINRGYVPEALKSPASRAQGQVSGRVIVAGVLRSPEDRSFFTPADAPARMLFYTRDPAAMSAAAKLLDAAPFSIDADETPNPGDYPRGGATVVNIPNNHLSYAVTWFGLGLTLLGVYAAFAWKRLRGRKG